MPFTPPPATLDHWRRTGLKPVADAEIALLEQRLGGKAPASYVEFMKTFGGVAFDLDTECCFSYVYEHAGREERQTKALGFIKSPEKALRYYEGLQQDDEVSLPSHLLPFAMDRSQGELLIEFGRPTERIFYWDSDSHDWGSGVTNLAFVANDLYELIDNLKPFGR
jgi:hypothetical protein